MKLFKRIGRNVFFKITGEMSNKIISFFIFIVIIRMLGETEFGYYSIAFAFSSVWIFLTDLGINYYVIREIARHKDNGSGITINACVLKIVLLMLYLLAVNLSVLFVDYSARMAHLINLMSLYMVGIAVMDYFGSIYNGFEVIHYETIIKVVQKIILLALVVFVFFYDKSLENIIIANIISIVIIIPLLIKFSSQYFHSIASQISIKNLKNIVVNSFPLGIFTIITLVYTRLDVLLLSFFGRPAAEIGWYSSVGRLMETARVLPFFMNLAIFPVIAYLRENDPQKYHDVSRKIITLLLVCSFPVSLLLFVIAEPIVMLLYGKNFIQAVPVLRIMCWTIIFSTINQYMWIFFFSDRKEKQAMFIAGSVLAASLCLYTVLIPLAGYVGAGYAFLICEILWVILHFYYFRHVFNVSNIKNVLTNIAPQAMTIFCLLLCHEMHPYLLLSTSVTLYFILIYMRGGIEKETLNLLKTNLFKAVNRKNGFNKLPKI